MALVRRTAVKIADIPDGNGGTFGLDYQPDRATNSANRTDGVNCLKLFEISCEHNLGVCFGGSECGFGVGVQEFSLQRSFFKKSVIYLVEL